MKLQGIVGKGSGKLGASVFTIRNGVQVVREYNPVVTNPKSARQTGQRAKFKLMTQFAAVLAKVIAMPRVGMISPRNRFMAENIRSVEYDDGTATIDLEQVKITKSVLGLPGVDVSGRTGSTLPVKLNTVTPTGMDRVVYVMVAIQADLTMRVVESAVITEAGVDGSFPHTFNLPSQTTIVAIYAYGVRDLSEKARVFFGDMEGISAENVAQVVTERILTAEDFTVSETRAAVSKP